MDKLLSLEIAERDARHKANELHKAAEAFANTALCGSNGHLHACVRALDAAETHARANLTLIRFKAKIARGLASSILAAQAGS